MHVYIHVLYIYMFTVYIYIYIFLSIYINKTKNGSRSRPKSSSAANRLALYESKNNALEAETGTFNLHFQDHQHEEKLPGLLLLWTKLVVGGPSCAETPDDLQHLRAAMEEVIGAGPSDTQGGMGILEL